MEIVPSTFIALAAIALLLSIGVYRGYWVFFAMAPMGAAAAFNMPAVGGASFGLKEFIAVAIFTMILATRDGFDRIAGSMRPWQPGFFLLLLAAYCVASAMFAPVVFQGMTDTFSIARNNTSSFILSTPLRPSSGNITQLFSFTISMLTFLAFATIGRLRGDEAAIVRAIVITTIVHIVLGVIDVAAFAAGLPKLLDVIRTANYSILDDHFMLGMKRMIGGFPEASGFGVFTVGLFGFWLHYVIHVRANATSMVLMVVSLALVLRSTSSGAYVALALFLVLYFTFICAFRLRGGIARGIAISIFLGLLAFLFGTLILYAAYELVDPFTAYLDSTIFNKLESQSGVERMSWNAQAFQNFLDTALMGAGLGSVRGSNWLLAALGNIGLPGTLLFILFLLSILLAPARGASPERAGLIGALKTGCAAMFLGDFLIAASPNLGATFFALAGLTVGLARATILSRSPAPRRALVERYA